MTFLSAAQSAAVRLIGRRPTTFFSSTSQFEIEIVDLANEVAADIVKRKDWRKLTKLKEMVGDGVTTGFDLPSDYDHLPTGMQVSVKEWTAWRYRAAADLNEWLDYVNGEPMVSPGAWIILEEQMQFQPAVDSGQTAQYYYISNNIVRDENNVAKSSFTADSDRMIYDERLLTLGLLWRWRAQKRLEYSEDLANFENLLQEVAGEDKGASILFSRSGRWPFNSSQAYPFSLGS